MKLNRDKQIEYMGIITDLLIDFDEMGFAPTTACPDPEAYAIEWRDQITNALQGYRKASEVAREIFEEIESKKIFLKDHIGNLGIVVRLKDIAELKKKYTEGGK